MPSLSGIFASSSTRFKSSSRAGIDGSAQAGRIQGCARKDAARHRVYDVTNGPTPPRGSVTKEKLCYLDWRLSHIRDSRLSSEQTDCSWIDGRNTIGRTSINLAADTQNEIQECSEPMCQRDPVSQQQQTRGIIVAAAPESRQHHDAENEIVAIYEAEKHEATAALKAALLGDSALVSVPHLAKVECGSESDSSSEDHHRRHLAAEGQARTTDSKVRTPSIFRRAGRRLSQVSSKVKTQETVDVKSTAAVPVVVTAKRPAALRNRILPIRLR